MELDTTYTTLWVIWGLMFGAIEGAALFKKDTGDTLSEHVWSWLGVNGAPKPTGYRVRRASLVAFLGWLGAHFMGYI